MTGCAVGPDYVKPNVDNLKKWNDYNKTEESKAVKDSTKWIAEFNDTALNSMVQKGLANNYDLKIAVSQVDAMVGHAETIDSNFYPNIYLGGASTRVHNSKDVTSSAGLTYTNTAFGLGLSNYEIDFVGKWRRADEMAKAELLQSKFALEQVRQNLVAEICLSYVKLRYLDDALQKAEQIKTYQSELLDIDKARVENGVITELELSKTHIELLKANDRINEVKSQIKALENKMCLLIGVLPNTEIPRDKSLAELYERHKIIPKGAPSELLTRRPDILASEQALIASNANIGFIRAQYFPSISLFGLFGQQSIEFSNIMKHPQSFLNAGLGVNLPIFTGGLIEGRENMAIAYNKQSLYEYKKTVLAALQEVDTFLYQRNISYENVDSLKTQEEKALIEKNILNEQYLSGVTLYATFMRSSINYVNTSGSLVYGQLQFLSNEILLAKALGGSF